jgi:hypothetical protein
MLGRRRAKRAVLRSKAGGGRADQPSNVKHLPSLFCSTKERPAGRLEKPYDSGTPFRRDESCKLEKSLQDISQAMGYNHEHSHRRNRTLKTRPQAKRQTATLSPSSQRPNSQSTPVVPVPANASSAPRNSTIQSVLDSPSRTAPCMPHPVILSPPHRDSFPMRLGPLLVALRWRQLPGSGGRQGGTFAERSRNGVLGQEGVVSQLVGQGAERAAGMESTPGCEPVVYVRMSVA